MFVWDNAQDNQAFFSPMIMDLISLNTTFTWSHWIRSLILTLLMYQDTCRRLTSALIWIPTTTLQPAPSPWQKLSSARCWNWISFGRLQLFRFAASITRTFPHEENTWFAQSWFLIGLTGETPSWELIWNEVFNVNAANCIFLACSSFKDFLYFLWWNKRWTFASSWPWLFMVPL